MTEVVVTTGAISRAKLQSSRHHQQTNTQLFTGRTPFLLPNQQCQSVPEDTIYSCLVIVVHCTKGHLLFIHYLNLLNCIVNSYAMSLF